jgi:hypothetical protein
MGRFYCISKPIKERFRIKSFKPRYELELSLLEHIKK